MTYLVEIKKDYALPLLKVLEQQQAIELKISNNTAIASAQAEPVRKRTFDALKLDTRGFKFNREEANER